MSSIPVASIAFMIITSVINPKEEKNPSAVGWGTWEKVMVVTMSTCCVEGLILDSDINHIKTMII